MAYGIPKFNLGKTTVTFFARLAIERSAQDVEKILNQHQKGNWGDVTPEEKKQNDEIVKGKDKNKKILSAYETEMSEIIWIVTDLGKRQTIVFLPHEYDIVVGG